MSKNSSVAPRENPGPAQMLWWLVFGRLGGAVLLLVISGIAWQGNGLTFAERAPLGVFVAVVALTIIYAAALRFFRGYFLQACVQLGIDVLLVSWLVWVTGELRSPFSALYVIFIAIASVILGPRGSTILSVASAVAFTALGLFAVTNSFSFYEGSIAPVSILRAVQVIGLNDIAFLVVGLLAARLSAGQTKSAVQLIATTQTLANLRALHERIVESIRSGVVTTDLEGRIYTFNAAAEEITGYKASDVRGQNASILFGELDKNVDDSMRAARLGETSPRFEADCLTPDGLRLRLGFTIFPLFSESGETTGMVITFQDLTQVRSLEESSRRQDRLAAVGRVAASIAHEIRNPLAAMRGSIQVLRSEVESDSYQAELMDIVLRESDRLNKIITDYLTYARPRSSAQVKVDVNELLKETFTLLRHDPAIQQNHSLEMQFSDGPAFSNADPAQLKQVFWNLARNALHAMPEGGTFRAEMSNTKGKLRIAFIDNGRGMSGEQVERLFEPFNSTTGGTGLGLSIVYQIVREHGGNINVRSRVGHGTTITIELPSENQSL